MLVLDTALHVEAFVATLGAVERSGGRMSPKVAWLFAAIAAGLAIVAVALRWISGEPIHVHRVLVSVAVTVAAATFWTWRARKTDGDSSDEDPERMSKYPEPVPVGRALLWLSVTIGLAIGLPVAGAIILRGAFR